MKAARHVDTGRDAEAGGADFVERDAADRTRKADRAAGLVLDPAHAELVGSHIGSGHVVADVADRAGEGANESFLVAGRHAGIAENHRLAAAVPQAGRGILPGHGAGEPKAFLDRHVRRHPHAADGDAACGVVDDHDGFQADRWPVDVDDARRTECIGEPECVVHDDPPDQPGFSRSAMTARRKRAASPPVTAR